MDVSDDDPGIAEFELDELEVAWSDTIETDDAGLEWLAGHELPPNVEGVDYDLGAG